jgi:hypothetical protein
VPLVALEKIRAAATVGEANALREEIGRQRSDYEVAVERWVTAGATGDRPAVTAEIIDLERRLLLERLKTDATGAS